MECSLSDGKGNKINLNPLRDGADVKTEDDYWIFTFHFCGNTKGCWTETPAYFEVDGDECQSIGDLSTAKLELVNNGVVRLTYSTSVSCTLHNVGLRIDTSCDAKTPYYKVTSVTPFQTGCLSVITGRSKYACPVDPNSPTDSATGNINPEDTGLSGGSIFLIVLLCLVFVYIVGGFVYNIKMKQMPPLESFPNKEIWILILGLTKDGLLFSFRKTKDKIKAVSVQSGYVTLS